MRINATIARKIIHRGQRDIDIHMLRSLGQPVISCFHQSYQAHFGGTALVSDIHQRPDRATSTTTLLAVDSLVYRRISGEEDAVRLQEDFTRLREWEKTRLINFHPDKYL